jgi:tetratricopeptide (TPR) repeat protein
MSAADAAAAGGARTLGKIDVDFLPRGQTSQLPLSTTEHVAMPPSRAKTYPIVMAAEDVDGLGHPFRAPSVDYLSNGFLREVEAAGLTKESTIQDIEERVLRGKGSLTSCPRDGRLGSAFVDAVHGEDNMGRATHMLSYTWGYRVTDIVDALQSYCLKSGLDPKRTYVWICALCVNQHRVHEKKRKNEVVPFETFAKEFGSRVQGINHVIALMGPWRAPRYITRAWCIYELAMAMSIPGCKLEFIMPPHEAVGFAKAVIDTAEGLEDLWQALNSVCIKRAEASVPADKEHIMRMVEEGIGLRPLNELVRSQLKSWFADVAEEEARRMFQFQRKACCNADGIVRVGRLLTDLGLHDRALRYFDDAKRWGKEGFRSPTKLQLARFLAARASASLWANNGKGADNLQSAFKNLEEADNYFGEVGSIPLASSVAEDHAEVIAKMGSIIQQQGDSARALTFFSRALEILIESGGGKPIESALGSGLLFDMGLVQLELQDFTAARQSYIEACAIQVTVGASRSPMGVHLPFLSKTDAADFAESAAAASNVGRFHCKHTSLLSAAVNSCNETLNLTLLSRRRGPRYAYVLAARGYAQLLLGRAEAQDSCEEAVRAYTEAGMLATPFGADALELLAYVRAQMLDDHASARKLSVMVDQFRRIDGLGPDYARLPPPTTTRAPSVKSAARQLVGAISTAKAKIAPGRANRSCGVVQVDQVVSKVVGGCVRTDWRSNVSPPQVNSLIY